MTTFAQHYPQHIQQLRQSLDQILVKLGLRGVVIHSGQHQRQFLDDMDYPFKVNPPNGSSIGDNPNCYLLIKVGEKPICCSIDLRIFGMRCHQCRQVLGPRI